MSFDILVGIATVLAAIFTVVATIFTVVSYLKPRQKGLEDNHSHKLAGHHYPSTRALKVNKALFGKYEGRSYEYKLQKAERILIPDKGDIEQFKIISEEDDVRVIGKSIDVNSKEVHSIWSGGLWRIKEDGRFIFGLELERNGILELGNLTVTLRGDYTEGEYRSGELGNKVVYGYGAEKVTQFSPIDW